MAKTTGKNINDEISATIPAAIACVVPELPKEMPSKDADLEELRKNITLQVQGEAVEVSENYPIPILMILFDIAYRFCREMVLKLNSGQRIMIFDHQVVPVLRDNDIEDGVSADLGANESNQKDYTDKILIDLEEIWKKYGIGDNFKSIINAVSEVKKYFAPSQLTILSGNAPALLFLLIQRELRGKTAEIWYRTNESDEAVKITSNL